MPNAVRIAAVAGAVVVAAGLGYGLWKAFGPGEADPFADCRTTTVAGGGMELGGPFELTAHTGERMTSEEVIDGPTLLYFGYTFCPDVCPFDTSDMAMATEILEERGIEVTPVFITIDPARDTPEALSDFVGALHPRMIGLTGSAEEIAAAARAWKVYYAKAGDDPQDYLMDHSTFTYLAAPGHGFLEVFRRETTPEEMADRVQCFVERL
ncbi:MAG: SCO family protein [Pseudomonadota bacterium]